MVGFTICPPKVGHLYQAALADVLTTVLERGLPFTLYQLSQVTGNELGAEAAQALAARTIANHSPNTSVIAL